jgi:hypothetical protein
VYETAGSGERRFIARVALEPGGRQEVPGIGGEPSSLGDFDIVVDIVDSSATDPDPTNNRLVESRDVYGFPDTNQFPVPEIIRAGQSGTISGTAAGGAGTSSLFGGLIASFDPRRQRVAKVEVAVLQERATGKAARNVRGSCRWLRNSRARFVRVRATRGRCATPRWLRATGTTRWKFRLAQGLPAGRYVVMSRATNRAGLSEDRFSAADRNRRTFTVRRRPR